MEKPPWPEMLTGIKNEQESSDRNRQRTVESNILPLGLHEDFSVTIIDVPGHGRYLKNTIQGLSGVDMAILVVAADDGVMPRTLEHLQILEFLGVQNGFVVLSKCDLVDDEIISMAKIEILDTVQDSFLEKSPILTFSVGNSLQLNRIIKQLEKEAGKIAGKNRDGPFRLWVDRICSFTGHGTVVCGTVQTGQVHEGDPLELFPHNIQSRARTLEVHRQKVSSAGAGQQVGINLPKIAVKSVARGLMLSAPGSISPCRFLNVTFRLSNSILKPLVSHQKVLVYLGTAVVPAQMVIMDKDKIEPGNSTLVQFRLKDPFPALVGDHVVITSPCEKAVIVGGKVLEASIFKFRQSKAENTLRYLAALIKKNPPEIVTCYMNLFPKRPVTADEIGKYAGIKVSTIAETIQKGVSSGTILAIGEQGFYLTEQFEKLKESLLIDVTELLENDF
jgi:selenocysteine-specific elongation factor